MKELTDKIQLSHAESTKQAEALEVVLFLFRAITCEDVPECEKKVAYDLIEEAANGLNKTGQYELRFAGSFEPKQTDYAGVTALAQELVDQLIPIYQQFSKNLDSDEMKAKIAKLNTPLERGAYVKKKISLGAPVNPQEINQIIDVDHFMVDKETLSKLRGPKEAAIHKVSRLYERLGVPGRSTMWEKVHFKKRLIPNINDSHKKTMIQVIRDYDRNKADHHYFNIFSNVR